MLQKKPVKNWHVNVDIVISKLVKTKSIQIQIFNWVFR